MKVLLHDGNEIREFEVREDEPPEMIETTKLYTSTRKVAGGVKGFLTPFPGPAYYRSDRKADGLVVYYREGTCNSR